jgi:hypothetical protein
LNKKISELVSGADAIKFKGYVNVENKSGVDALFDSMKIGEACLVAPSVKGDIGEDSYKSWVASAMGGEGINIASDLLKTGEIDVTSIIAGKGEVRTYFKLDEAHPYCQCPDILLLCKISVKAKQGWEAPG